MRNFALGWLIFTCGEQSFTKGGGFLLGESRVLLRGGGFLLGETRVLQSVADVYLGRTGFYKGW
jgi:hypothetical protein